jgi:hypothetical protein
MKMVLPNSIITGHLELIEVFDYYDGPKLFGCINAVGQRYLGYWVGSDDIGDSYWIIAASKERYEMVRSGGISLLTALSKPELGYLYRCSVRFNKDRTDIETLLPDQLPTELLPDPDEALNLSTETLPERFAKADLSHRATATRREIVGIHFNFPGTREEAPTKNLGRLLLSFQDTLDALGQYREGNPTLRGMIAPEILTRTETRLICAAGASFAVEIIAAQQVNLFGDSLITDAMAEFVEILEIGNDVERLRDKLFTIKARATSKYRLFLSALIEAHSPLKIDWSSPKREGIQSVDLDLPTAAGALKTAEEVTRELGETRIEIGYFLGVELPAKSFIAILRGDENVYRGRLSEDALATATHITLNQDYRITIQETYEITAAGEERSRFEVAKIEPADSAPSGDLHSR